MTSAVRWIIARSDWHAKQAIKQIYRARRPVSCLFTSQHAAAKAHRKLPEMRQEEMTIFEFDFDEDQIKVY